MEVNQGLAKLKDLLGLYDKIKLQDANEAETRKKVIDGILEQVLGWEPDSDISYEVRVSQDGATQFADYIIKTASTSIVIEAKRAGQMFMLPHNYTTMKLGGVLSEGNVGEAIRQARDYARNSSIPYAVVTNGNSWIIFPAIRTDGIPFEESQAKIFRSLTDIKERFVEFWNLLSRQRVIEGSIETELFGKPKSSHRRRLIATLKEPGFRLGRNVIYQHIEPAVSLALTDEALNADADAMRLCYVKSTERVKHDSRIQMYLTDLKPPLGRKVVRPRREKKKHQLDETIKDSTIISQQFLLILGPVGAGKTTFINYTRNVSASHLIEKKIIWLYIDFRKASPSEPPRSFIYRELMAMIDSNREYNLGSWDSSIKPAYADLIDSLKEGALKPIYRNNPREFDERISEVVLEDRKLIEPFVQRILRSAGSKQPVYLVIDNVDQLEDEQYQNLTFIEAQSAARLMHLNVMLSLRDVTYLKYRNSPVFDAFQVDTIYIDPPPIKPVLSRRFAFAKKILLNKHVEIVSEKGIKFRVMDLSVFFDIVSRSLLAEDAGYMLEVLSGGDVRRGLGLVRDFLASGHVSADQALHVYLTDGDYRFPTHEIFKGAILGQRKYFREEESFVMNIFDSRLDNMEQQLLRYRIMSILTKMASVASFDGLSLKTIQEDLYRVGISAINVQSVVVDLQKYHLVRTVDGLPLNSESILLPTRLGGYVINELSHSFEYYEPCIIDASIYDDQVWNELNELTAQIEAHEHINRMTLRIRRAELFRDYLQAIDNRWVVQSRRYNLNNSWDEEVIMQDLVPKLNTELSNVAILAEHNQQRQRSKI